MAGFFDLRIPFFRPLYRRVLTTAVCAFWLVMELLTGGPLWAALFAGLTVYCTWHFFVTFNPADFEEPDK